MSNPNQYATFEDAVALLPSLESNASAELLFDFFSSTVSAFVDPGLVGQYTNILSMMLTLHFLDLFYKGESSATFTPNDWVAFSGSINGIEAEKVSLKFSGGGESGNRDDVWESDLSQTKFGQTYLDYIKAIRTTIGIDGQGNLWACI